MVDHDDQPKRRFLPKGWRRKFLAVLTETGVISYSAKAVGVSVKTVARHRAKDPKFDTAVDDAIDESCDALEMVARRRATEGTARPVYQGGDLVGTVQDYSDTLLIFLLKANRPEKFRDNYDLKALVEQLRAQSAAAAAGGKAGA